MSPPSSSETSVDIQRTTRRYIPEPPISEFQILRFKLFRVPDNNANKRKLGEQILKVKTVGVGIIPPYGSVGCPEEGSSMFLRILETAEHTTWCHNLGYIYYIPSPL
jgi:hypothetical protein